MKKNGFSLVELLAVIAIIAVVATIGIFSSITIKKKMNKKLFETTLNEILTQATTYANDNKEEIAESAETQVINSQNKQIYQISVDNLKSAGYYKGDDDSLISYITGETIKDASIVLYGQNNSGRMNACFSSDESNANILGDDASHNEFGKLGIYCSDVSNIAGFTQIAIDINSEDWLPQKTMIMKFTNLSSDVTHYKVVEDRTNCKTESGWLAVDVVGRTTQARKTFTEEIDEAGKTYYICVKDSSGQITRTSKIVNKIDNTVPSCVDIDSGWIGASGIPIDAKAGCTDDLSKCQQEIFTKRYTIASGESAENLIVTIKDNAGNTKDCVAKTKVDNIPPICKTATNTNTNWIKGPLTITQVCEDNESGCAGTAGSANFSKTFSTTSKTGTITIKDNAGNTTDCTVDVYIDKTPPICDSVIGYPEYWTNSNLNIRQNCADEDSKCVSSYYTKVISSNGDSLVIKDKAGNETTCYYEDAPIDKDKPVIIQILATNSNLLYQENQSTLEKIEVDIRDEVCTPSEKPLNCTAKIYAKRIKSNIYFYEPHLAAYDLLSGVKLQNCELIVYDKYKNRVADGTVYFGSAGALAGYADLVCTVDDEAGNTSSNKAIISYSIYGK